MNINSKKELIPVLLAIIGLIADVLGIYSIIKGNASSGILNDNSSMLMVFVIIIIYAWIAISWFLILRAIRKDTESILIEEISIQISISVGIFLLPIYALLLFSTGYKLVLIYVYLLLLCILALGIGVLMKIIYSEKSNKIDWDAFSPLLSGFMAVFILGAFIISMIQDGIDNALISGRYECVFPFNGENVHIKTGESIVAVSESNSNKIVITDSLGKKDTISKDVLDVHLRKIITQQKYKPAAHK